MNSIKHVMPIIVSDDNILGAMHDEYTGCCGRRKRRVEAMLDEDCVMDVVAEIRERLLSYDFALHPPVVFDRIENDKLRHIVAPDVEDAILIRAITRVMEPLVYAKMTRHSYCPIPGRGGLLLARDVRRKLRKLQHANEVWLMEHPGARPRTIYALKGDVFHFFHSVAHAVGIDAVRRVCGSRGDARVIWLLDRMMGDHLDIGAGYSAMIANAVLMPVDEEMESYIGVLAYYRYMDDVLLLFRSKDKAHAARRKMEEVLNRYGLTMANKWQVFDTETRPIVMGGFKIRRTGIHPSSHVCQGINRQLLKGIRIGFENLTPHECRSLASRYGWIKNSDAFNYKTKWRKYNADIVFKRCRLPDGQACADGTVQT